MPAARAPESRRFEAARRSAAQVIIITATRIRRRRPALALSLIVAKTPQRVIRAAKKFVLAAIAVQRVTHAPAIPLG
ncbi:MAG: hypothetical protein WBW74_21840 [Xanthobacteraceae bacterium]